MNFYLLYKACLYSYMANLELKKSTEIIHNDLGLWRER